MDLLLFQVKFYLESNKSIFLNMNEMLLFLFRPLAINEFLREKFELEKFVFFRIQNVLA
jgi:hypothetical protein